MRIRTIAQILMPLLISGVATAQQNGNSTRPEQTSFDLEEAAIDPIPLPQEVLKTLAEDEQVRRRRCPTDDNSVTAISPAWFEASQVHLGGPGQSDLIVKAKDGCLFGANLGPFWIFESTPKEYKLVLSVSALNIRILRDKTNGLRDVLASAVAGGKAVSVTFKFDGQKYKQSGTKTEEIK